MVSFNNVVLSAFLLIIYASSTAAAPWPIYSKHATHRTRHISRDPQLESFHPKSTFETFGKGIEHPLRKRASDSLEDSAISFVESRLGLDSRSVSYQSGYSGEISKHAYISQVHEGVPFANAVSNVAFNAADQVVSFASSFVKPSFIASSKPSISLESAIETAEQALNGKFNGHPPTIEYLALDDGTAALTRVMQIQDDEAGIWKEAFVDAHSGKLLSVTDFVAKASYRVLPINKQLLTEGFEVVTNPQDVKASPAGWHTSDTTSGNNVFSFKSKLFGLIKTPSSPSSPPSDYIYYQDPDLDPSTPSNVDAARVNTFYIVNMIHDISYRYGFTEKAYNFQDDNFHNGGEGGDRITVSVQDPAGTDNANFATPPDGQPGKMRMYLWDFSNPRRDGALENDVVVHEATHGITNRLTGGGTGRCLQSNEAGGMGEGWSDAFAEWTEQDSATVNDYTLGQYIYKPKGIRTYPYSTSDVTNPLRYSSVASFNEVHIIGEVWANMLHNVYAALVAANGFSSCAFTDPTGDAGNVIFMHNFMDGLALQPCNPTFVSARDAFLQADENRYGGTNKCTIWKAFASRGLGVGAVAGVYTDNTDVPEYC